MADGCVFAEEYQTFHSLRPNIQLVKNLTNQSLTNTSAGPQALLIQEVYATQ